MGFVTSAKMLDSYAARCLAAADTGIDALRLARIDGLEKRVEALNRSPDDRSQRKR